MLIIVEILWENPKISIVFTLLTSGIKLDTVQLYCALWIEHNSVESMLMGCVPESSCFSSTGIGAAQCSSVSVAHSSGQLVTAAAAGQGCLPIDCPAFHGGQRAGRSAGSVSAHPLAQGLVLEAPPQAPGGRQPAGGEQDSRPGGGRQQGALHPGPGGKYLGLHSTSKHIRGLARQSQLGCLPQLLLRQLSWSQGSNQ